MFWNSEVARTLELKEQGVLAPYVAPNAKEIPREFKDSEGYWAGFAARARVLIVNTKPVSKADWPDSIFDLADAKWKGKAAIANPLFGTTSTHVSALFAALGQKKAEAFFEKLKANGVRIVAGNATVRDRVAQGVLLIGLTDTDDVNAALRQGKPVAMIFPDQDGIGTLLIPNTVALIEKAPHPETAKKFINYLLSAKVEAMLAASGSLQIPLKPGVEKPENVPDISSLKTMSVSYEAIATAMPKAMRFVQETFLR